MVDLPKPSRLQEAALQDNRTVVWQVAAKTAYFKQAPGMERIHDAPAVVFLAINLLKYHNY
jgi:hypothetical protein